MSDKSKNPPALPVDFNTIIDCDAAGMTLSDYFAGQSLAGIMANIQFLAAIGETGSSLDAASHRYAMADAMLKARQS